MRAGRWSLTMAWWAVFSAMFWICVAVASAGAVGVVNTFIGMALTVVTYGAINKFSHAMRHGQGPQSASSPVPFSDSSVPRWRL
jgi:hypothetical protein